MKIAFIRRNWSATGGAENYLVRLVTHLKKLGHHSTLVCESWHQSSSPFDSIISLPSHGLNFRKPNLFALNAGQHLTQTTYDLVFSMERGIKADIYRAGDGVHLVWLRHRQQAHPFSGFIQNTFNLKNQALLQLEKYTFSPDHTRYVIANSQMVKNDITQNFPYPETQIETILNGVDVSYFSSGNRANGRKVLKLSDQKITVLLVGSGAKRKGHALARSVVNRWKDQAELVIIDSPPACPLPDVYAAADIFLFPTLYDPFANVTLEAMAAGLPVITTRANGAHELIRHGENGLLVHAHQNKKELAYHLEALLDPVLRKRIGAAGAQTAQQWCLDKNVSATLKLMEKVSVEQI